jgi:hypothetical protein
LLRFLAFVRVQDSNIITVGHTIRSKPSQTHELAVCHRKQEDEEEEEKKEKEEKEEGRRRRRRREGGGLTNNDECRSVGTTRCFA